MVGADSISAHLIPAHSVDYFISPQILPKWIPGKTRYYRKTNSTIKGPESYISIKQYTEPLEKHFNSKRNH